MKTNYVINMIHTSLVLALCPAVEKEWDNLARLYDLINQVKVCGYPYLTPHITLAYYNYNGFDVCSVQMIISKSRMTLTFCLQKTAEYSNAAIRAKV